MLALNLDADARRLRVLADVLERLPDDADDRALDFGREPDAAQLGDVDLEFGLRVGEARREIA